MSNKNQAETQYPEINQEQMMELISLPGSISREVNKTTRQKEVAPPSAESSSKNTTEKKEVKESKHKKQTSDSEEYEAIFIKPGELNVRNGKAIYIRPDFHKTIARIVQTIGDGKISLTDYVDNVFAQHFQHYEKEIKESFNRNNEPIL